MRALRAVAAPLALSALAAAVPCAASAQRAGGTGAPHQASARQSAAPPGVQFGIATTPDTVTVGDPFIVRVRVRAPHGATVEFPAAPDTGAPVEALDPRVVTTSPDSTAVDQTAAYRLVAWDVGNQPLGLGDVTVRVGGEARPLSLGRPSVHVRSVLPRDSAQRVPKPPRDLIDQSRPWWLRWLWAILLALALLGLLIWWWYRRRRRRVDAVPALDPYELAEREFARVQALGLVEAGERGRFVALMVEVLRDYLARELPAALPSLTSSELLDELDGQPVIPAQRLRGVLAEADLIKFARRPVGAERARDLGREAQAIAHDVHANVAAAVAAAAAAAAAAATTPAEPPPAEVAA